jgi:hypothetical protein
MARTNPQEPVQRSRSWQPEVSILNKPKEVAATTASGFLYFTNTTGCRILDTIFNFYTQKGSAAMMAIPAAPPMTGHAIHALFSFEVEEAVEEEEEVETAVVTMTVVSRGLVGRDSELANDAEVCKVVPAEVRRII